MLITEFIDTLHVGKWLNTMKKNAFFYSCNLTNEASDSDKMISESQISNLIIRTVMLFDKKNKNNYLYNMAKQILVF